jgi:hypothetical protein
MSPESISNGYRMIQFLNGEPQAPARLRHDDIKTAELGGFVKKVPRPAIVEGASIR